MTTTGLIPGADSAGDPRLAVVGRLAKAARPDRELDFWCWWYGASTESKKINPVPPPEDYVADNLKHNGSPHYTGSIDAARALIPEGMYWLLGEGKTRDDEPLGSASIIERRGNVLVDFSEAEHELVEIALCMAALKARATIAGQGSPVVSHRT